MRKRRNANRDVDPQVDLFVEAGNPKTNELCQRGQQAEKAATSKGATGPCTRLRAFNMGFQLGLRCLPLLFRMIAPVPIS
jgi:hypothetical protein